MTTYELWSLVCAIVLIGLTAITLVIIWLGYRRGQRQEQEEQ